MATLNITEFDKLATDANGNVTPVGQMPAIANQSVTFTTSTASAAFNARTNFIRVVADADVHLSFGLAPTATVTSTRLEANVAEYFGVIPAQKVAAYDGSS